MDSAIAQARAAGADLISFSPTDNPRWSQSIRYQLGGYVRTLGEENWRGRLVDLRPPDQRTPLL